MNLAAQSWEENNLSRLDEILRRYDATKEDKAIRNFEWRYLRRLSKSALNRPAWPLPYAGKQVRFSSDGHRILVSMSDNTLLLCGIETSQHGITLIGQERLGEPFHHLYFPTDAEFVPHQLQLVRPSGTGTQVSLYDIPSRTEQVLEDQRTQIEGIAVSPDGRLIASGTQDGNLRIWDLRHNTVVLEHAAQTRVTSLAFSPDSHQFICLVGSKNSWRGICLRH